MPADCYIGLMSGTSIDGIDAAAAVFEGGSPELIAACHHPYPKTLRSELSALTAGDGTTTLETLLELDHRIGSAFADAAQRLLRQIPARYTIRAIGSHGQTVYHLPGGRYPNTLQLGDPNLIAERTGIITIGDWRRRDMAAGGQGAPLAPAFHCAFLRQTTDTAVLNLGGIANLTLIPAHRSTTPVAGFDTGPGNTLLDRWIQHSLGRPYDERGEWAASGQLHRPLLDRMLTDDYFDRAPPKSTGQEHFNLQWLNEKLGHEPAPPPPNDVAATLVELTAASVAGALRQLGDRYHPTTLYVCGGGVHNTHLMDRLAAHLPTLHVTSSATAGIDPDQMEAMAFAWFASKTLAREPIDTTMFTGARGARILGATYAA